MRFEWDHNKNRRNVELRGLDFNDVDKFDWHSAIYLLDNRSNYGETRVIALGKIEKRLTVLVFTPRLDYIRIISWRKANKREIKLYGNQD